MTFNTPILIIAWRRPDKLHKLITSLKHLKPKNIYIACDGPNKNRIGEYEAVNKTRELIDKEIDWKCLIKKKYSTYNQGCKLGVSKAITWFFENVEEGIIFEDDCIPHPDFFEFSSEMLKKYRNDTRIWCITASNFLNETWIGEGSYFFSRYNLCWGWATWKRCWKEYDKDIKLWPVFKKNNLLKSIFKEKREIDFWEKTFDGLYFYGKPDTWDFQWTFCCFKNSGLTISPNVNLIENIGFGDGATHTISGNSPAVLNSYEKGSSGILPIVNPNFVLRSEMADKKTESYLFSGYSMNSLKFYFAIYKRLKLKFANIFKFFIK